MTTEQKIRKILDLWEKDLLKLRRSEEIMLQLMEANSMKEVDKILEENYLAIKELKLCKAVINARKRILAILQHKKKIWGETLN